MLSIHWILDFLPIRNVLEHNKFKIIIPKRFDQQYMVTQYQSSHKKQWIKQDDWHNTEDIENGNNTQHNR